MPEELWTEVHDIVQEVVTKTTPKKKKCKKAKRLSEEALQIAEEGREAKGKGENGRYIQLNSEFQRIAGKRREAKGKGEKERYIHLTAEFQGIARRDKKAFLSDQCKEIQEKK